MQIQEEMRRVALEEERKRMQQVGIDRGCERERERARAFFPFLAAFESNRFLYLTVIKILIRQYFLLSIFLMNKFSKDVF